MLIIFKSNKQIGLIGMVGYEKVAVDGVMWHELRQGSIYIPQNSYPPLHSYRYSHTHDGVTPVAIVDGLFIATSVDLPWNEVALDGWDFYDAFQSMNYLLNGYLIVVPNQKHPWCLHDDKKVLNLFRYDEYRQKFIVKYANALGKNYKQIQDSLS